MITLDKKMKILVQGFTGKQGTAHSRESIQYGTNIIGGTSLHKVGETHLGLPVFSSVEECVEKTSANTSIIYVPGEFAADAILEAIDAKISFIVCITEGIPAFDMLRVKRMLSTSKSTLLGPNSPGVILPHLKMRLGIMPSAMYIPGKVAVISRSGTLLYEASIQTTENGLGQSVCIGIGGDHISGMSYIDVFEMLKNDEKTEAIVMIGEIGGNTEIEAANYIKNTKYPKPVLGLVVGERAPKGKRMGHAGAIITSNSGDAKTKIEAMREAGISIIPSVTEIGNSILKLLKQED